MSKRRSLAAAWLATLSICGCSIGAPNLGMQTIQTSVRYGGPSPTPSPSPSPQVLEELPAQLPAFPNWAPVFPYASTAPACPSAPPNSYPAEAAGDTVTSRPQAGAYRWQQSGSYSYMYLTFTIKVGLSGLQQRYVRRIADQSTGSGVPGAPAIGSGFTFQTIEPDPRNGSASIETWQVHTSSSQADQEAGIVLKKIESMDNKGRVTTVFDTGVTPGLMYMPLPIVAGATFTSSAQDPVDGIAMQNRGTVGERQRIDACGQVVDGWTVSSSLTVSGSQTYSQTLSYIVAPQLGGVIIMAKKQGGDQQGNTLDATYTLGQLDPDPLPDSYK